MKRKISCLILICFLILAGCSKEDEWIESISSSEAIEVETTTTSTVFVYVCGKVKSPGVYELPNGSRYADAIKAAGGIKKKGDLDSLNLAQKVSDGEKIEILSIDDKTQTTIASNDEKDGLININTADASLLQTLSGIGKTKAEQIVAYRKSHGNFKSIEEIMKVPGIKEGAFAKIKDSITI